MREVLAEPGGSVRFASKRRRGGILRSCLLYFSGPCSTANAQPALGFEPSGITPAEFGAYIKAEIAKWRRVIEQSNMDKI